MKEVEILTQAKRFMWYQRQILDQEPDKCFMDNSPCSYPNLLCIIECHDPKEYPFWICDKIKPFYDTWLKRKNSKLQRILRRLRR